MAFRQSVGAVLFRSFREQLKTIGKEAGNLSVPMLTRAADARTGQKGSVLAKRKGAARGIVAKRDGLFGEVLHHAKTNGVVQFIHVRGIIGGPAGRAAFENDDVERGALGKLFGHEQASPAAADDDGVNRRKRLHGSSSLGRTFEPVA